MEEEFTVSLLSALIKRSVEQNFGNIRLKAEVSALKEHSSGHFYFSLKDADSVIDAVCWKYVAQKQKIKLENGMEITCTGRVTTFPKQSKYQFVTEHFELSGIGELLKMLEERKKKLEKEGLFDLSKKKKIPFLPKLIGVITSPTGAVIRDILHRLRQRFPRNVLLWPVLVQGSEASRQISDAIKGMNELPEEMRPDLLIVARGGGSFEDLMPFNEENVVRATAASKIPIISAVGHETDTTLIDYASDLRAPTPTAAAEFAVPERLKLQADVSKVFSKLNIILSSNLERRRLYLSSNKILNIQNIIGERIQKADYVFEKLLAGITNFTTVRKLLLVKLSVQKPMLKEEHNIVYQKLHYVFSRKFENAKNNFALVSNGMESNSYMKILSKGFAFAESLNAQPVTSVKDAEKYKTFDLVFSDGRVRVRKEAVQEEFIFD